MSSIIKFFHHLTFFVLVLSSTVCSVLVVVGLMKTVGVLPEARWAEVGIVYLGSVAGSSFVLGLVVEAAAKLFRVAVKPFFIPAFLSFFRSRRSRRRLQRR